MSQLKVPQAAAIMQQFIIYWMITVITLYCLEVKLRGSDIAYYGRMWVACPYTPLNGQIDETGCTDARSGFYSHIGCYM